MSSRFFSRLPAVAVAHLAVGIGLAAAIPALSQSHSLSARKLPSVIDESKRVSLTGSTHRMATARFDIGAVPDSMPLDHMFLQLKRSQEQENSLNALLAEMQDPKSPKYHHWLTADQIGAFGPAKEDLDTVVSWVESHGLRVNHISKNGLTLDVSGTAGQVRESLHTEMHGFNINGKKYIANVSNPELPEALTPVVVGFNSLNSFMPRPALHKPKSNFTFSYQGTEEYNEAPADFATIYNVKPLYKGTTPITGKGQTVAVLEATDVNAGDIKTFRKAFGLSGYSGSFTQIHPGCDDPGKNGAEGEAALDAEWAGAIAPDARVVLASCASSDTTFGPYMAAQNLLDENVPPPIMSLSYIDCEADLGPAGNYFVLEMWFQAALEGVSVFVAAGDGGPAGCDDFDTSSYAIAGIQANGLASTPFDTATGGTDFYDTFFNQNSKYWNATNSAAGGSAKSYVPEMTWNESCASDVLDRYYGIDPIDLCNLGYFQDIVAGGGAPSFVYAKPDWQAGVFGNPNDSVRDLPDVSLFASGGFWNHAILYCMSDASEGGYPCDYTNPKDTDYNSAGGTSFTAPQYASIQALINQKSGGPQGNAAPVYYSLGTAEYGTGAARNSANLNVCNSTRGNGVSSSCSFYDVQAGSIALPCYGTNNCYGSAGLTLGVLSTSDTKQQPAYKTDGGWDFATGLGSINVTNIVNRWP